jgi:hypothetical protein
MKCYAMITELSNRARYVKFGVSEAPDLRVGNVQVGSPLRIEKMLVMDCSTSYHARVVEAALHLEHSEIHASGEWFKFDSGTTAEALARESMKLVGERVFARAVVTAVVLGESRKPRMYKGKQTKTVRGYEPIAGDRCLSHVKVLYRRKPLIGNA